MFKFWKDTSDPAVVARLSLNAARWIAHESKIEADEQMILGLAQMIECTTYVNSGKSRVTDLEPANFLSKSRASYIGSVVASNASIVDNLKESVFDSDRYLNTAGSLVPALSMGNIEHLFSFSLGLSASSSRSHSVF
jgi:hypothetical protein